MLTWKQFVNGGMGKSAMPLSELKEEIDFILEGLGQNRITKRDAAISAAIGSAVTGAIGAGIGAATGKKSKRIKRALIGALLGSLPGAAIGPMVAQYRKYMAGVPFDNSKIDIKGIKPGEKVYLGVAGSANGENESWFADEMRKRFPGKNYMVRHVDGKKLEEIYRKLNEAGADVSVVGHSSGGRPAAKFLRKHPELKGYLIDPVSWTGRTIPDNAIVFTSDKSTRHGGPFENTIADVGGRWNYEGKNSVVFKGSHSDRIRDILRDFVARGMSPRGNMTSWPDYVTYALGREL